MYSSEKEFLNLFGWNSFYNEQNSIQDLKSLVPARVICEERNLYRLQLGLEKNLWATISGKLQFSASSRADYPAVGDWVMVEVDDNSNRGVIHKICPRKSIIYRKQVGSSSDMQILSTNVDYIFITTSVNEDLNFRRIERYLTVAWDSGAVPVILLTKVDICSVKIESVIAQVQLEFPGVQTYAISKNEFESASFFSDYLKSGKTTIFIGSSGVGKSTLVNFLTGQMGHTEIKTKEIREADGKGRHTTTSRNLYVSRFGGLVIDTPGMRELQLSDHAEGIQTQFSDIELLITTCRFSDCKHDTEPNCAIKKALTEKIISEERWERYQKLEREVRHMMRKQDKVLSAEDKKLWKKRSIFARNKGRSKKGYL